MLDSGWLIVRCLTLEEVPSLITSWRDIYLARLAQLSNECTRLWEQQTDLVQQ